MSSNAFYEKFYFEDVFETDSCPPPPPPEKKPKIDFNFTFGLNEEFQNYLDENGNALLGSEEKYNCKPIQNTSVSDEKQAFQSYSKEYKHNSDEEKKQVLDSDDDVVNGINVSEQTLSGNAFFFMEALPSCSYPYVPGTLVKYPGFPNTYWCCLCKSVPLCVEIDVFLSGVVFVTPGPINLVLVFLDLVMKTSKILMLLVSNVIHI